MRAKFKGTPLPSARRAQAKVVDLMEALRHSLVLPAPPNQGAPPRPDRLSRIIEFRDAVRQEDCRQAEGEVKQSTRTRGGAATQGWPTRHGSRDLRSKRDFKATSEPRGKKMAARKGDSDLIQKHAARRLDYYLRLEMDGVLKSWAVTRGPSLVPGEKRLAVHVEDHPLETATSRKPFRRRVRRLHGHTLGSRSLDADRDPHKGDAKGIRIELSGEKLRGDWHSSAWPASPARSARTGCRSRERMTPHERRKPPTSLRSVLIGQNRPLGGAGYR